MTNSVLEFTRKPRVRVWLLVALVLVGFWLRLIGLTWGQGYLHFGQGDGLEAYAVAVDYGLGEEKAQYLGQPNYNHLSKLPGPLWTMFCFGALRWGGSIKGVMLAIILVNTLAIYFCYRLAERSLGQDAAVWTALFAATLPWVIYYSQGVYNPDVMPVLGALLALALWDTIGQEHSRSVFWVPLLVLAMPQFHMSGLMMIPAVVTVLLLSPARLNYPCLGLGLAAGAALYVPYLRGDMANHWQNTIGMARGGSGYSFEGLKAISAWTNFLVNWGPRWATSASGYRELGRACFGSFGIFLAVNLLSVAVAGFLLVGMFQMLRPAVRGLLRSPRRAFAESPGVLLLGVLTFVPLLVAIAGGQSFHTRYCLVLLPTLLALAGGAAVAWLRLPRFASLFLVGVSLTTATNLWLVPAMFHYQGRRIQEGETFVPSFDRLEFVYQQLKLHAGAQRWVRVEDAGYLESATDRARENAALIRIYVQIREKERLMRGAVSGAPIVFRLEDARATAPGGPDVALRLQGLALVTSPPR